MTSTPIPFKYSTFRVLDIHVSEVKNHPGVIQDILFNRRLDGIIIREVFPKNLVEKVLKGLQKDESKDNSGISSIYVPAEKFAFKNNAFDSYGHGLPTLKQASDLKEYFAFAPIFRQACCALFQGNYEKQLESVFQSLSGGLPVQIPTNAEGVVYSPSHIRMLKVGYEFPIHAGNDFVLMPQASHLLTIFDLTDQLSFFIPLALPDIGGELIVYSKELDEEERENKKGLDRAGRKAYHEELRIDEYESMALTPGVGDMLLFDGGRYYHSVSKVEGTRTRITIGGFLNFSRERDTVYYWA